MLSCYGLIKKDNNDYWIKFHRELMYISQLIAAESIELVFSGRNLTSSLSKVFEGYPKMTYQQRAVAQDLSYGTLRFLGNLDAILGRLLERPIQDEFLRCLLLVALYQLEYGRAENHTIVNQAVNAVSKSKCPWAKALINGVLRNFIRNKKELNDTLPHSDITKYSYQPWWISKVKEQYPFSWESILVAGNQHPPMTLRVNRRQMNADEFISILKENNIEAEKIDEFAVTLLKALPVEKIPGFFEGDFSVQDYGAQFAAQLLDLTEGARVLDACSAPGGKTGHILEMADVDLLAIDNDQARLSKVESNLRRLNLNARLLVGDASTPEAWWDGKQFDRILADVPCTASGIVRRHVDIKWLRREDDIVSFTKQQELILPSLWRLLRKGGKLLYVTCSIFKEENLNQIEKFLQTHNDAEQIPLNLNTLVNIDNGQILPTAKHDGFYYNLLQKK